MADKVDVKCGTTEAIAKRLAVLRCPVESCEGRLTRRMAGGTPRTVPIRGGSLRLAPHPEVKMFEAGCDGPVMHIFAKHDLNELRPRVLRTVTDG